MADEILDEEEAIAEERAREAAEFTSTIAKRPIRELPTLSPAICVTPDTTVRKAVDEMIRHRVACVLVVVKMRGPWRPQDKPLVGTFTGRDVLSRVVAAGQNADTTRVADVMTADPECLTLDDGIAYALNKMSVGGSGTRHIPLVDKEGRPTNVVTMRNIVDFILDLFPSEVLNLPPSPALSISRQREGA